MIHVRHRGLLALRPLDALGLAIALGIGVLLVRLSLTEAAILLGLAGLALGTVLEPLVGVAGGLFLGLLRAYLQAEVPAIPAQIGHVFIFLAVASWAAEALLRQPRAVRPNRAPLAITLPLLTFIGAAWLSLWAPVDLATYGLPEFAKWIEILAIFLLVAQRTKPQHLPWLVGAVLLVGTFQAAVGLYQFALRGEGPEHFLIPNSGFYRAYGTFEQPNPYAGYLGMTLALGVGLMASMLWERVTGRQGDKETRRIPLSPCLLVSLSTCLLALGVALGASWSRGAWMGFAAALAAMAVALPRRARWGLLLLGTLVVLVVALYAAGLLPASLVARLTDFAGDLRLEDVRGVGITPANYAVVERLAHWQTALEMWRHNFWTGVGLGGYEAAYPLFALVNWPFALGHAHNIYLNLLAETGLIGLSAYLVLWGAVIWQTWRVTRVASGLSRGVAIGLLGAWTQLTVHQLFDNLYVNNVHFLVGICLGMLALTMGSRPRTTPLPLDLGLRTSDRL